MGGATLPPVYLRYTLAVIRSFRHKGLEAFFRSGSKAGIQPKHALRLRLQLGRLDAADSPAAMALPGWRLHALKGRLAGHWAVWVDKSWRLTFTFSGPHAIDVDYLDYH
jgi:toxin HigB-1